MSASDEAVARVDPARCPLCGSDNRCGAVAAGAPDPACWCVQVSFAPALLAQVPAPARMRACICAACAAAGS